MLDVQCLVVLGAALGKRTKRVGDSMETFDELMGMRKFDWRSM
jgi:hypothetical protein